MLLHVPADRLERFGQLSVTALIAILLGWFWVAKGLALIVSGTKAEPLAENTVGLGEAADGAKHVTGLYLSLFLGVLTLASWLGLLAFNGFTDSITPLEHTIPSGQSTLPAMVLIPMLLTWWPYAMWRRILQRESNRIGRNVRRHKRVVATLAATCTVVMSSAISFGVQNGYDRQTTLKIDTSTKQFGEVATKIGAIKSRNFQTTQDYIKAYEEIGPLLDDFDQKMQFLETVLAEARERDIHRGPFNIQLLYARPRNQAEWNLQVSQLLKEDSALTRKQVQLAAQMAALPEADQVEFWNNNFLPLAQYEDRLRQKLALAMKPKSSVR